MQLLLARHLWGVPGSPIEKFGYFKEKGYQAIEAGLPSESERVQFSNALSEHKLEYFPQIFTTGQTVAEHLASFRQAVEQAATYQPRFINAHSGSDAWSVRESEEFFREALRIEADAGVAVAHETHRGRILFHPTISRLLLEEFAELKLCCDLSHWVCVCERLLGDQEETIHLAAERCLHVHARVGYEEGPQVPDPRAPEYQMQVEAHERWWRQIWQAQKERGMEVSTLTPEFGPPLYQQVLPYTQEATGNLDEICNWQAERQLKLFQRFLGES